MDMTGTKNVSLQVSFQSIYCCLFNSLLFFEAWTHFTEYQEAISKKEPPKQRLKPIVYPQRKVQEIEKKKVPFKIRK